MSEEVVIQVELEIKQTRKNVEQKQERKVRKQREAIYNNRWENEKKVERETRVRVRNEKVKRK